jgi:hypothetical protein
MLSFSMAAGSATALGRRPLGPVAVRAFLGRSSPSVSEPSISFSSCAAFLPAAGRLRFAALLDAAEGRALRFEPAGVPPAPLNLRPPVDFLRELFGAANSSPEDCESNARCQMGRSSSDGGSSSSSSITSRSSSSSSLPLEAAFLPERPAFLMSVSSAAVGGKVIDQ